MNRNLNRNLRVAIELGVAFAFISVSYVNCARTYGVNETEVLSETSVSSSSVPDEGRPGDETDTDAGTDDSANVPTSPDDDNRGVAGGHFDLDTASRVLATNSAGRGGVDHHVHEYDNKYDVTSVDYFNMLDNRFTKISSRVKSGQIFYIIIGNSELSPGAHIRINGSVVDLPAYRQKFAQFMAGTASLPTFTLDGNGATKLDTFSVTFDVDAIIKGDLVPTLPQCVFSNKPGPKGEYRNGALTVQLVEVKNAKFNNVTKTAATDGGMLWESMVYWHKPNAPCL